ncbi:MAG: phosphoribosylformylglycinamidine cyclo-ligase [Deltaproteobacteria bacterium]|nr:phosphoribosylformylglycinamidine cyclo-ligase [Deltaproteobacteria bacterium]
MEKLTYQKAGVSIEAGDKLVERIRPLAEKTLVPEALGRLGGFSALCALPSGMREPVMVSGTDGVGTKLKVAFMADRHDTIGIDLVAMCVNDIITSGARPLFFLDYFATGKLDVDRATSVIRGITGGCLQAGCALLGGETAEMPGLYRENEYDLAGFAVGIVERQSIITGETISSGDSIIAVASSGLHSNGYSLVRKVLFERAALALDHRPKGFSEPLVDMLLRPTRIYVKAVESALSTGRVKGLCHITGGGLVGNIPRILPRGLGVELETRSWKRPAVFDLIAELGEIEEEEMRRAFNLGIGFVVITDKGAETEVIERLVESGENAWQVGTVSVMSAAVGEARVRFI